MLTTCDSATASAEFVLAYWLVLFVIVYLDTKHYRCGDGKESVSGRVNIAEGQCRGGANEKYLKFPDVVWEKSEHFIFEIEQNAGFVEFANVHEM